MKRFFQANIIILIALATLGSCSLGVAVIRSSAHLSGDVSSVCPISERDIFARETAKTEPKGCASLVKKINKISDHNMLAALGLVLAGVLFMFLLFVYPFNSLDNEEKNV